MVHVPSIALNTGARLPLFGLGTWTAQNYGELKRALNTALDAGYRLIDTAESYRNEHIIGEVLEEQFKSGKLQRKDVFITTKLPSYSLQPKAAEDCIRKQLFFLRVDYIDMYLIHSPCAVSITGATYPSRTGAQIVHEDIRHIDTWRVLENHYKSGQLKALGLSNFNAKQIRTLYNQAEIKPANLQVEMHIYWPQHELFELCNKLDMTMTAYAPIGSPGRMKFRPEDPWPVGSPMEDPLVLELAKKYGKTPAQILLRHLLQRGVSVIPKSTNPERIRQNIGIFDFELSADDQQKLLDVKKRVRLFEARFMAGNKNYPFDLVVDLTKR